VYACSALLRSLSIWPKLRAKVKHGTGQARPARSNQRDQGDPAAGSKGEKADQGKGKAHGVFRFCSFFFSVGRPEARGQAGFCLSVAQTGGQLDKNVGRGFTKPKY